MNAVADVVWVAFGVFAGIWMLRKVFSDFSEDKSEKIQKSEIVVQMHTAYLALPVIQYAVANLPPETNKGWPYESLKQFATALRKDPRQKENEALLVEIELFAKECEAYETERLRNPPKVTRATAADFGPKTPEAEAAHAFASKPDPDPLY